jgi:hypothetical protein
MASPAMSVVAADDIVDKLLVATGSARVRSPQKEFRSQEHPEDQNAGRKTDRHFTFP